MLPNFAERLEAEVDRLTPSHLVPKVILSKLKIIKCLNFKTFFS